MTKYICHGIKDKGIEEEYEKEQVNGGLNDLEMQSLCYSCMRGRKWFFYIIYLKRSNINVIIYGDK